MPSALSFRSLAALRALPGKARRKIERAVTRAAEHARDRVGSTRVLPEDAPVGELARRLPPAPDAWLDAHADVILAAAERACAHTFDLLGSGPTRVAHGVACPGLGGHVYPSGAPVARDARDAWVAGLVNAANAADSVATFRLVDAGYAPIDWQLDFRSGYRWSERTYFRDIAYGDRPGVDVKVPWELARMNHLPALAHAYGLAKRRGDGERALRMAREVRNQILDFIATNPPRYGVNWSCAMDVAIRAASWLTACDLLVAYGADLDVAFEFTLLRSAREHALHVVANVEWLPELRSNHYLANVAGLLVVAAYLPDSDETTAWLGFAVHELIAAVGEQFGADGGNFEGSTSYHRLSAEMVVYATAFALAADARAPARLDGWSPSSMRLTRPIPLAPLARFASPDGAFTSPFPPWYFERVERMAELAMAATAPDGRVVLVGDNDEGRFLKLQPPRTRPDGSEDLADHRHLVAAIAGLVPRADLDAFAGDAYADRAFVAGVADARRVPSYRSRPAAVTPERRVVLHEPWELARRRVLDRAARPEATTTFTPAARGPALNAGLEALAFPDFGLYVLRSARVYLAIRCGPVGQLGQGGHDHNDQLALSLVLDGVPRVVDPGTYVYTSFPELRNVYRSVRAHFAPRAMDDREPASLTLGLFRLGPGSGGTCHHFSSRGFVGSHRGYGAEVARLVEVQANVVLVVDAADASVALRLPTPAPDVPLAPGYGRRAGRDRSV